MKFFLTILLITGFCFAEEPTPKPLPKDVQTIVDAREKALQEARIAFDKAVFKANDDAVKKMETVVKTNTQKGDLDGALASKKFVEEWNKEKETVAVTGALGGAGPKDDLSKMIVGKWIVNGQWPQEFLSDNTAKKNAVIGKGRWSIKDDKFTISWDDGNTDIFNIPKSSEMVMIGTGVNGMSLSAKKIK